MKIHRVAFGVALLVLTLGSLTSEFALDSNQSEKSDRERRAVAIALVRTINTVELAYKYTHGSYGEWRMLLMDNAKQFEDFLSINGLSQTNSQFADYPGILPGWNMRLMVNTDGQGYEILLEDKNDKKRYAALSDERGAIRECKWLE